jgi:cysteine-rich protein
MSNQEPRNKVRQIQANDCSIGPMEMRYRLLKGVMGARLDQPAEYAIITGCRSTTGFTHLIHLIKLLNHYKVDYTFLSEETCCGNSFLDYLDSETCEAELEEFQAQARAFQSENLDRIKALGIRKIVTACPGCNTRYNQFQSDGEFEVLYYTQLLARYAGDLRLDCQVNFYEGCHKSHRTPGFKIDTTVSKSLIGNMQELDVTDIPNYCCRNFADKIFEKAAGRTIVTPTSCCLWFLTLKKTPDSPEVVPLTQMMCKALGII